MRVICALFLTCLLSCSFCACKSSDSGSGDTLDKYAAVLVKDFFQSIEANDGNAGIMKLLSSNPFISLEDSATKGLILKFNELNTSSGKYRSAKLIKTRNLNDDVALYSYLVKYERQFYRFNFLFYNDGVTMRLHQFSFDDSIEEELETWSQLFM